MTSTNLSTSRRGRRVGIGRGDGGLELFFRDLPVEGRVAGAPEERRRGVQQGQLLRIRSIQAAQVFTVRHVLGPGMVQGPGLSAEVGLGLGIGGRHGPQDPDAGLEHQLRGGHPRHQRDLRVPVFHWQRRAGDDEVVTSVVGDFLVGDVQAGAAPAAFELDAFQADFLQQLQVFGCVTRIDVLLDLGVT
jgi:hypothetical protein